jgi:hypothetical protein
MIAIINGNAGGRVTYNVASDQSMDLMLLDDNGAPLDFSLDTASLEVYAASNRETVSASKALSGGTAAAGHGLVVLADDEANWVDLNAGQLYFGKVKIVEAGGDVVLSENSFTVVAL